MKLAIIDDEEQSHKVLKHFLKQEHPSLEVVASGYNITEGFELLEHHQPDLVFLDVEMPDGTGFDLLQKIGKPRFMLIFITAHSKYAVSAFHFGALDFLQKPITSQPLADAIMRVQEKRKEGLAIEQLKAAHEAFKSQQKLPSRMTVSCLEGIYYIPVQDIIRLEASGNSTEIFYLGAKKRLISSVNIGTYKEQFAPYKEFFHTHRTHIVNLLMVESYIKGENHLILKDGSQVPVSRENRADLLQRLKEI